MNKMNKYIPVIGNSVLCIFFGLLAWTTATGDILKLITFPSPNNELGFYVFTSVLSVLYLYLSVTDLYDLVKNQKS
jgi:hypothetical protein